MDTIEVLYKNRICILSDIINVLVEHETIHGKFNGELCSYIIDVIKKRTGKEIVWTVYNNGKNDTLCSRSPRIIIFVIKFITKNDIINKKELYK